MRYVALSIGFVLSACGASPTAQNTTAGAAGSSEGAQPVREPTPIKWQQGPEDSVYFIDGGKGGESARRCWHRAGGYDCLNVGELGEGTGNYTAMRFKIDRLTTDRYDASVYPSGGYMCQFFRSNDAVSETLGDGSRTVTTNVVSLRGETLTRPITLEQANKAFADNRIKPGSPYFDCVELAGQVLKNGAGTLTTTAVTYKQMMP